MALIDMEIAAVEDAMEGINKALKGIPGRTGLKSQQRTLAKLVAELHTELRWARARSTE